MADIILLFRIIAALGAIWLFSWVARELWRGHQQRHHYTNHVKPDTLADIRRKDGRKGDGY